MAWDSEVVVTGIGVVSPIGIGRAEFWRALADSKSGIVDLPGIDTVGFPRSFGGAVLEFDGRQYVQPRKALKVMSRELQIGFAASMMALDDAKIIKRQISANRVGTVFGSEMYIAPPDDSIDTVKAVFSPEHGVVDHREIVRLWGESIQSNLFPLWLLKYLPNMPACHVGIAIDAQGPNNSLVLGDTSGLAAIIEAATVILRGHADVMIAGASGTKINPMRLMVGGPGPYASRRTLLSESSRPYASDRDGFVGGEGAAAVVLETAAHANSRGAPILARISGWSNRLIAAPRGTRGSSQAVSACLSDATRMARLKPSQISHVDGHAMGDPQMDSAEALGIIKAIPGTLVTATKSLYGHLGAACGMVEFAGAVLSIINGFVPPTLNAEVIADDCPVQVATRCHDTDGRAVIKLSHTNLGHAIAIAIQPPM